HFYLAQVDVAFVVAMQKFDRVFDGDDVLGAGGVDTVDHGRQRRGLTGAGDSSNQHQAARHVADLLHHLGQEQFIERANLGRDDAEHQSDVAALLKDVDTKASQAGDAAR